MQIYPWILFLVIHEFDRDRARYGRWTIRHIPYKDFVYFLDFSRVYPHAMDGLSHKNS